MRKILIALSVLTPTILFGEVWECNLTSYGAISGFDSKDLGKSWVPDIVNLSIEDKNVSYYYFDSEALDESAKTDGTTIVAKDDISIKAGNVSWLLKTTLNFDTSTHIAKLSATNKASGFVPARMSGYYACK